MVGSGQFLKSYHCASEDFNIVSLLRDFEEASNIHSQIAIDKETLMIVAVATKVLTALLSLHHMCMQSVQNFATKTTNQKWKK